MDRVQFSLEKADVDLILKLLDRKIEKVEKKEVDEKQIQLLKELRGCKADIVAQVAVSGLDNILGKEKS